MVMELEYALKPPKAWSKKGLVSVPRNSLGPTFECLETNLVNRGRRSISPGSSPENPLMTTKRKYPSLWMAPPPYDLGQGGSAPRPVSGRRRPATPERASPSPRRRGCGASIVPRDNLPQMMAWSPPERSSSAPPPSSLTPRPRRTHYDPARMASLSTAGVHVETPQGHPRGRSVSPNKGKQSFFYTEQNLPPPPPRYRRARSHSPARECHIETPCYPPLNTRSTTSKKRIPNTTTVGYGTATAMDWNPPPAAPPAFSKRHRTAQFQTSEAVQRVLSGRDPPGDAHLRRRGRGSYGANTFTSQDILRAVSLPQYQRTSLKGRGSMRPNDHTALW